MDYLIDLENVMQFGCGFFVVSFLSSPVNNFFFLFFGGGGVASKGMGAYSLFFLY